MKLHVPLILGTLAGLAAGQTIKQLESQIPSCIANCISNTIGSKCSSGDWACYCNNGAPYSTCIVEGVGKCGANPILHVCFDAKPVRGTSANHPTVTEGLVAVNELCAKISQRQYSSSVLGITHASSPTAAGGGSPTKADGTGKGSGSGNGVSPAVDAKLAGPVAAGLVVGSAALFWLV